MFLYLNLLPKQERRKIRIERFYSRLKREAFFLGVVIIFFGLGLFYAQQDLQHKYVQLENRLEFNKIAQKDLIDEVERINSQIEKFKSIQNSFTQKSQLILSFFALVPEGITISELRYNDNQGITITGEFKHRDNFLEFKSNLEKEFLSEIDDDVSDLLKETDGEFKITGIVVRVF